MPYQICGAHRNSHPTREETKEKRRNLFSSWFLKSLPKLTNSKFLHHNPKAKPGSAVLTICSVCALSSEDPFSWKKPWEILPRPQSLQLLTHRFLAVPPAYQSQEMSGSFVPISSHFRFKAWLSFTILRLWHSPHEGISFPAASLLLTTSWSLQIPKLQTKGHSEISLLSPHSKSAVPHYCLCLWTVSQGFSLFSNSMLMPFFQMKVVWVPD